MGFTDNLCMNCFEPLTAEPCWQKDMLWEM